MPLFIFQMEPLSFSVAALLGEKLSDKSDKGERKEEEDASTHPVLPPTPQPSDSEEDEPPRKRRCVEQCELAKVNKVHSVIGRQALYTFSLPLLPCLLSYSLPFDFSSRLNRLERRAYLNLLRYDSVRARAPNVTPIFLSFEYAYLLTILLTKTTGPKSTQRWLAVSSINR